MILIVDYFNIEFVEDAAVKAARNRFKKILKQLAHLNCTIEEEVEGGNENDG